MANTLSVAGAVSLADALDVVGALEEPAGKAKASTLWGGGGCMVCGMGWDEPLASCPACHLTTARHHRSGLCCL